MPKNVTFWIIFIHFTVPNFDIFAHQRARKEEGAQLAKSGNTARGFLTFLRHARQHLTKLDSIAFCLRSSYHTVRKSQNLFKKSIFRKNDTFVNLNFGAKNQWFVGIFMHCFSIRFWIFPTKNVKIQLCSIFDNSVFDQNHDFWRKNSNYSGNFSL